jgi:hypothetical protein
MTVALSMSSHEAKSGIHRLRCRPEADHQLPVDDPAQSWLSKPKCTGH